MSVALKISDSTIKLVFASPPAGTVSFAYPEFTFSANGGSPPYTWAATGTLPPGLTLSANGSLSGTPTQAGTFSFAVTPTDSAQTPVNGPPFATQILITNSPSAVISGPYRATAFSLSGDSGAETTINFDGTGHVSGSQVQNNGGNISTTAITGTYSLAADNTLTTTPVGNSTFIGAVSQDRAIFVTDSELYLGLVPAIQVGVREGSSGFTDQSLNGPYQLVSYGNSGNSAARWTLSFNGAGHFAGSEVINNAGAISTNAVAGTYAVAADGKLMLTPSGAATLTGGVSAGGDALVMSQITPAQPPSLLIGIRAGPSNYTDATLSGVYKIATYNKVLGNPGAIVSFDGKGQYFGELDGTYAVSGNGSVTLSPTSEATVNGRMAANGDALITSQTTAGQAPSVQVGVKLAGIAPPTAMSLVPSRMTFTCSAATVGYGCSPAQNATLTNHGTTRVYLLGIRVFTWANAQVVFESNNCPNSLGPGENCTITVSPNRRWPLFRPATLRVYDTTDPLPHTVGIQVIQ